MKDASVADLARLGEVTVDPHAAYDAGLVVVANTPDYLDVLAALNIPALIRGES